MSNAQRVINLINRADKNIKFSCFNDCSNTTNEQQLYDSWISFIKSCLGNCCFTGDICALIMCSEEGQTFPHPVRYTEDVLNLITNCFDVPKTLRLDLIVQSSTTFTWLFALSSDLQAEGT